MESADLTIGEAIEDYVRTGWSRMLPPGAVVLLGAVAQLEAQQGIGELDAAQPLAMQATGLAGPAWEPLSDEDLADEARMAVRRKHEEVSSCIAAEVGVPPPRTQADVADLMVRLGLIERIGEGASVRWKVVRPLPRLAERRSRLPRS
jgi:hypothetical protein